ncbi:MAG: DNA mismatch endonuclease Vsr [Myxococcales bacterium]|nr:MAG: DNA mismatch endonuclease Vsr [Myxococcales bacterium]
MADVFSKAKRSRIMAAVKGRDTSIELTVRKIFHRMGYRYRLENKHLPGNPDLTFRKAKIAVFVNGCFWHGHSCKRGKRIPKTNRDYWKKKIGRNVERDKRVRAELKASGWRVCVVWECDLEGGMEKLLLQIAG